MTQLANTFEGGSDGTTITTGNSGGSSGNALDAVSGTGTAVYSNSSPIQGSLSALLTTTSTQTQYFVWNTSWTGVAEVWVRIEGEFAAFPGSNTAILQFRESAGNVTPVGCEVQISPTGAFRLRAPQTLWTTSSTTVAANTKFRLELRVVSSATVGLMEARLYVGANLNGSTPTESFSTTNRDTGDGTVGGVAFGVMTAPGTGGLQLKVDNVVLSDEGWVGPSTTVPAAVADLAGTAGDQQAALTWTAPADGGAAITDYIVQFREVPV